MITVPLLAPEREADNCLRHQPVRDRDNAHAAVSDQELARRLLGVPEDRFCAWLIALGVPADRPLTPIQRPNRRPFEEVVHRGHW